jgi:hypothetical protein
MHATRFFLDAAADGRVCLGHMTMRNSLTREGDEHHPDGGRGEEFRWQRGDTGEGAAMLSFRIGDRLFHVAVTSEIKPLDPPPDLQRFEVNVTYAGAAESVIEKATADAERAAVEAIRRKP